MKRNKAIAHKILHLIEEHDVDGAGLFRSELLAHFAEQNKQLSFEACLALVEYHLELLVSANFLRFFEEPENRDMDNFGLTWAGHDELEKAN